MANSNSYRRCKRVKTTEITEPARPSRLLSLPGEIRNVIYELVAATDPLKARNVPSSAGSSIRFGASSLLLACRKTHREFATLWRETAPAVAPVDIDAFLEPGSFDGIHKFLRKLPKQHGSSDKRELKIFICSYRSSCDREVFSCLDSLKSLVINAYARGFRVKLELRARWQHHDQDGCGEIKRAICRALQAARYKHKGKAIKGPHGIWRGALESVYYAVAKAHASAMEAKAAEYAKAREADKARKMKADEEGDEEAGSAKLDDCGQLLGVSGGAVTDPSPSAPTSFSSVPAKDTTGIGIGTNSITAVAGRSSADSSSAAARTDTRPPQRAVRTPAPRVSRPQKVFGWEVDQTLLQDTGTLAHVVAVAEYTRQTESDTIQHGTVYPDGVESSTQVQPENEGKGAGLDDILDVTRSVAPAASPQTIHAGAVDTGKPSFKGSVSESKANCEARLTRPPTVAPFTAHSLLAEQSNRDAVREAVNSHFYAHLVFALSVAYVLARALGYLSI
ncbi:hypothetical protein LTR85_001239 [Meristemomyces frigidus]|nr:hypothetical protein LTR85_001239 [Meristemomyces frigidus]